MEFSNWSHEKAMKIQEPQYSIDREIQDWFQQKSVETQEPEKKQKEPDNRQWKPTKTLLEFEKDVDGFLDQHKWQKFYTPFSFSQNEIAAPTVDNWIKKKLVPIKQTSKFNQVNVTQLNQINSIKGETRFTKLTVPIISGVHGVYSFQVSILISPFTVVISTFLFVVHNNERQTLGKF